MKKASNGGISNFTNPSWENLRQLGWLFGVQLLNIGNGGFFPPPPLYPQRPSHSSFIAPRLLSEPQQFSPVLDILSQTVPCSTWLLLVSPKPQKWCSALPEWVRAESILAKVLPVAMNHWPESWEGAMEDADLLILMGNTKSETHSGPNRSMPRSQLPHTAKHYQKEPQTHTSYHISYHCSLLALLSLFYKHVRLPSPCSLAFGMWVPQRKHGFASLPLSNL